MSDALRGASVRVRRATVSRPTLAAVSEGTSGTGAGALPVEVPLPGPGDAHLDALPASNLGQGRPRRATISDRLFSVDVPGRDSPRAGAATSTGDAGETTFTSQGPRSRQSSIARSLPSILGGGRARKGSVPLSGSIDGDDEHHENEVAIVCHPARSLRAILLADVHALV